MEGKGNSAMTIRKTTICAGLIVLFYSVGFIGFSIPAYANLFKTLIPFHLLLMLALIIISHQNRDKKFFLYLLVTYIAGYLIELLGVKTGLIFGAYNYGSALGIKLFDIPLMIGVNWILVIYSAGMLLRYAGINNPYIGATLGALLVTVLDYFIEPVAISYDYWSWENSAIPLQNYIAWFVFSFFMFRLFYSMKFAKKNMAASVLFIVQFIFFFALNIKSV